MHNVLRLLQDMNTGIKGSTKDNSREKRIYKRRVKHKRYTCADDIN